MAIRPEQKAAYVIYTRALRNGDIVRGDNCEICGDDSEQGRPIMHGHHEDYSKPTEVNWLCPGCHGKVTHHGFDGAISIHAAWKEDRRLAREEGLRLEREEYSPSDLKRMYGKRLARFHPELVERVLFDKTEEA